MTSINDIKWGSYKEYEGPVFYGTKKYSIPESGAKESHRILAVITATEGGSPDAINMYDRCVLSASYIQWCEAAYFLVSNLLGAIAEKDVGLMDPMKGILSKSNAKFEKTSRGKWKFHFNDGRGEVDEKDEQKQLYFMKATGYKGSWDDQSKSHAKLWAASVANVLIQDAADVVAVDFTASKLRGFAMPVAKQAMFHDSSVGDDGWPGAVKAAYLSFAANLPAVAGKQFEIFAAKTNKAKWSKDWCIDLLAQLTFGPNISIYPHRYNKIRPVIEKLYGVDLPDFADELKRREQQNVTKHAGYPIEALDTPEEIQAALIKLRYDLGPSGADGKFGKKSRSALMTFQRSEGLKVDGEPGPVTKTKLWEAINR